MERNASEAVAVPKTRDRALLSQLATAMAFQAGRSNHSPELTADIERQRGFLRWTDDLIEAL